MDNEHYCSREEVGGRGWRGEGSEYERWVGGLLYMNNIARRGKERESLGILASLSRFGERERETETDRERALLLKAYGFCRLSGNQFVMRAAT